MCSEGSGDLLPEHSGHNGGRNEERDDDEEGAQGVEENDEGQEEQSPGADARTDPGANPCAYAGTRED